jgi:hypothetical protein
MRKTRCRTAMRAQPQTLTLMTGRGRWNAPSASSESTAPTC